MYKIIATDLDETLLNDQKHVSKADIDSISKLQGTKLVIATGRGFEAVQANLKEIGLYNADNQYLISFNGGVITECKNNRILYSHLMPFEDVKRLFEIGLQYDVFIHIYTLDCCYAYRLFENEKNNLQNGKFNLKTIEDTSLEFFKDKKIAKVLYCKEDMDYLRKVRQDINLDNQFSISFSSNRYLEINPLGIDKGTGLKKLCEILNIDVKDTIAVGDNINDQPMIVAAGLGIGVKNCIEDIKKDCDVILDYTNNEDPITNIVNLYLKN